MESIISFALQLLVLLSLLAAAFIGGCVAMLAYRGPIRWRWYRGGPFWGQYNLGAHQPHDLYLRVMAAIANPGSRVGPRPGSSWPEDHPAWAERDESNASWSARAALFELGVGVRLEGRTVTSVPLSELSDLVGWSAVRAVEPLDRRT